MRQLMRQPLLQAVFPSFLSSCVHLSLCMLRLSLSLFFSLFAPLCKLRGIVPGSRRRVGPELRSGGVHASPYRARRGPDPVTEGIVQERERERERERDLQQEKTKTAHWPCKLNNTLLVAPQERARTESYNNHCREGPHPPVSKRQANRNMTAPSRHPYIHHLVFTTNSSIPPSYILRTLRIHTYLD
ncbi:hypothetical protein CTA2_484 [Colletotrichum tanaceti]|nr:hypothetical protein CTA2_484 [Colletotrichum tanaceti]